MDDGLAVAAQMVGRHHVAERGLKGPQRVGHEARHPRKRLVLFGVQDVEDHADQKRMAGLLPMVAAFQGAFRVHQNIGDVLHVADFVRSLADFEQWIVTGAAGVGRIEQEAMGELRPPACGQLPILALDIVNDDAVRPGQQCRHHKAHAFAGARRRERHDMLRAVVAQIIPLKPAEENAGRIEQTGFGDVTVGGPAGRTIGRDVLGLAGAPQRSGDSHTATGHATQRRDATRFVEDRGRISVIGIPPDEQGPDRIDGIVEEGEPWRAKLRLKAQMPRGPFCREPHATHCDGQDGEDGSDEKFCGRHG